MHLNFLFNYLPLSFIYLGPLILCPLEGRTSFGPAKCVPSLLLNCVPLNYVPPLDQTVNETMAVIAFYHRSRWELLIKHSVLLIVLTPGNRMINPNFVHDVVDLDNKQVKVDSLDEHPTEGCHQKILHKGRHCNTATLHKRLTG